MYFFVKDNIMGKHEFDFRKLMKKKDGEKFINALQKEYIKVVKNEIVETLEKTVASGPETLRQIEKDDNWLRILVYSLIHSSKAVSKFSDVALKTIDSEHHGEFKSGFEDNMTASAEYNIIEKRGIPESIETVITLKPKGGNITAEEMGRALAATFHGGEFKLGEAYNQGASEEEIILNATPGFYEDKMVEAGEIMREYFEGVFEEKMDDSLKTTIAKELKKYK